MAAALNWIIKDGLGQLGGVVYASFVSDKFDSEPKRFRFQATVAMQGANVLELLTPLWPGSFLLIASISNIGMFPAHRVDNLTMRIKMEVENLQSACF